MQTDSIDMETKLISDNSEVLEHQFPLDKLPLVVGRSLEAAIRIVDRWASRRHCEIAESDGSLVVRDLGSTHGTLLNGQAITESPLIPGDKLTIGLTTFLVSDDQRRLRSNARHNYQSSAGGSTLVLRDAAAEAQQIVEEISRRNPR